MRYKLCLIAGLMGVAVISGIIEALAIPRTKTKEGEHETGESALPAPSV